MQQEDTIDLKRLLLIIKRQKIFILIVTAFFLIIATAYIKLSPPLYTAETLILLDKNISGVISEYSKVKSIDFATPALESEVQVIQSKSVTQRVVKDLKQQGLLSSDYINVKEEDLLEYLPYFLKVNRVRDTYVLSIKFTAESPKFAAAVANTYANKYIESQIESLDQTNLNTSNWLRKQIDALSKESINAKKRVDDYRKKYNKAQRSNNSENNESISLLELRNLEKEAETYASMYETYLEKMETTNSESSFPIIETRIITKADPPKHKSHPKTKLIVGASIILGLGLGIIFAIIIDNFDKTLKRGGQIRRELQLNFLGFLDKRKKNSKQSIEFLTYKKKQSVFLDLHAESLKDLNSLYTKTIQSLRNEIDNLSINNECLVIGITSEEDSEAKRVISENLALFVSYSNKCLLLDASGDVNTKQTNQSTLSPKISDIIHKSKSFDEILLESKELNLSFLSLKSENTAQEVAQINQSNIKSVIHHASKENKYIIINLPKLTQPSDLHPYISSLNGVIIAASWGKTLSNDLNFNLSQSSVPQDKILGVVLENTDMKKMKKYYGHKSSS